MFLKSEQVGGADVFINLDQKVAVEEIGVELVFYSLSGQKRGKYSNIIRTKTPLENFIRIIANKNLLI